MSLEELANALDLNVATIEEAIDRLVEMGLVQVEEPEESRSHSPVIHLHH